MVNTASRVQGLTQGELLLTARLKPTSASRKGSCLILYRSGAEAVLDERRR